MYIVGLLCPAVLDGQVNVEGGLSSGLCLGRLKDRPLIAAVVEARLVSRLWAEKRDKLQECGRQFDPAPGPLRNR